MISPYQTFTGDHYPDYFFAGFTAQPDELKVLEATQAQVVLYKKVTWNVPDAKTGEPVERGLRYGDNPTQEAALYRPINGNLVLAGIEFIHLDGALVGGIDTEALVRSGKHPGRINLTDIDSALGILRYLSQQPAVAIIKHNNPSGVAIGERLIDAYQRAWEADPVAPFGGVLVSNRPLCKETAQAVSEQYYEVVCAPDYEEGVVDILASRKNLRIIRLPNINRLGEFADRRYMELKTLTDGSVTTQWSYAPTIGKENVAIQTAEDFAANISLPTDIPERLPEGGRLKRTGRTLSIERKPTEKELRDMWFAWMVECGVVSNSIVAAKDGATIAIGVGGQDRVLMARQVVNKAYASQKALLALRKYGMIFDALALEVRRGAYDASVLTEIEEKVNANNAGLRGAVVASDAFFPFRDGTDALLQEGITAIAQPGGSLRDYDSVEACNEVGSTMVLTHQRCFKH